MTTETQSGPTSQKGETVAPTIEKGPSWIALELLDEKKAIEARLAAEALEAEIRKNLPSSTPSEDVIPVWWALKLVGILTGSKCDIPPQTIRMPETEFEQIVLELSSTGKYYYRVTASHCPCKGFHYNHNCSHFKRAFPKLARIGPISQTDIEDYKFYLSNPHALFKKQHTAPYEIAKFIEMNRDVAKIQAKLAELADQKKFDSAEYKRLEKDEYRYAVALGF